MCMSEIHVPLSSCADISPFLTFIVDKNVISRNSMPGRMSEAHAYEYTKVELDFYSLENADKFLLGYIERFNQFRKLKTEMMVRLCNLCNRLGHYIAYADM